MNTPVDFWIKGKSDPVWIRPNTSDWFAFSQIFLKNGYAVPSKFHASYMQEIYESLLEKGVTPLIIDCGANIGLSSLWFHHRFPRARIIAIEPELHNYSMALSTCQDIPAIETVLAGVSSTNSKLWLEGSLGGNWGCQTAESNGQKGNNGMYVAAVTINELIKNCPETLFITKIDIEGFETSLMSDHTEWAENCPVIVFESHDRLLPFKGSAHAFLKALTGKKRDYIQSGENTFAFLA